MAQAAVSNQVLQDSGYNEVWTEARKAALTPAQQRSPLARRHYDLRHAGVSLWLKVGRFCAVSASFLAAV